MPLQVPRKLKFYSFWNFVARCHSVYVSTSENFDFKPWAIEFAVEKVESVRTAAVVSISQIEGIFTVTINSIVPLDRAWMISIRSITWTNRSWEKAHTAWVKPKSMRHDWTSFDNHSSVDFMYISIKKMWNHVSYLRKDLISIDKLIHIIGSWTEYSD